MILGRPRPGATATNLPADRIRVTGVTSGEPLRLSHLAAYLDGGGPNAGAALIRGVIYDTDDNLIARGDEVSVPDGTPAGWVQLPFGTDGGLALPADDYSLGIHVGGVTNCARTFVDDPGATGSRRATDTYADGTETVLPAATDLTASLPVFASAFQPMPPPAVDDDALARLPWDVAQRILGATGPLRESRVVAIAGWHGTVLDEETGAFAIVRSDGPLADRVGERVRVSRRVGTLERAVVLTIHNELAFPDELVDEAISLTRRAFLELAPWATDSLEVIVETLA